jgi:hypothetical protein
MTGGGETTGSRSSVRHCRPPPPPGRESTLACAMLAMTSLPMSHEITMKLRHADALTGEIESFPMPLVHDLDQEPTNHQPPPARLNLPCFFRGTPVPPIRYLPLTSTAAKKKKRGGAERTDVDRWKERPTERLQVMIGPSPVRQPRRLGDARPRRE